MLTTNTIWLLFGGYMVMLASIAAYAYYKERNRSIQGYFTASGSIGWFVLIMTYIASLMSTWVFFAGPGGYYRGGLVFWISELSYIPLFPIIAYFVMNKVWILNSQRNYITPADLYTDRFRSPLLRLVLAIVFLSASFPYIASILIAAGRAAEVATGGAISYNLVVLVVGLTMLIFVSVGGMKSVATADTIQGWLFITMLWVVVISVLAVGFNGSLTAAVKSVWVNTNSWFSYPGPDGWVPYSARLGYPLACAIGWTIMLPHVFVRAGFSGSDLRTQQRLLMAVPILQTLVWTGTMLIGLVGIGLLPGLSTAETELIIPFLIETVIQPYGATLASFLMIGFFLGAVAVGLSTANAFLLVSGSIISQDFLGELLKVNLSEKSKMLVARIIIVMIGLASMLLALNPPELIWTLIMFAIALVMPLFPVLVAALYWKRATTEGAIAAAIAGTATVLLTYFQWGIGWKWYGAIGMLVSAILVVVVSLVTKKTDEKVLDEFYGALKAGENKFYVN